MSTNTALTAECADAAVGDEIDSVKIKNCVISWAQGVQPNAAYSVRAADQASKSACARGAARNCIKPMLALPSIPFHL